MRTFLALKTKQLKQSGINNASKEIEWLLKSKFSISTNQISFTPPLFFTTKQYQKFNKYIQRRTI